ncbi:MAG: glycine cleavage system aminomethyltransferase GcvT [Acidimicrobiales bacterium]
MADPLRRSPLDAAHRALGARMVGFGGWDMPLSYDTGTLAEHRSCRDDAVAFDVSHLGTVRVEGDGALEHLNGVFTNDLRRIGPGLAQYTHLLDEADASVLDDIIVWWRPDGVFDVMPNASNTSRVVEAIGGEDVTADRAIIAVQGPFAREWLSIAAPQAAGVPRFEVAEFDWEGVPCVAAGTGYTGEDGVECAVPATAAPSFWAAVMATGIVPAGLGARDTLRLEAGLPLHGHELGPGITPLQAGLGWVVAWDKPVFAGRAPLEAERKRGPARRLRGLVVEGRQPPREGCPVVIDGKPAGEVTSGNFSPMLGHGIALAFLPPAVGVGAMVSVDIRDKLVPARVVKPPFAGGGNKKA